MCTNRKEITLPNGRKQFVNCGHCEACQQQKANNNTFRIRSEVADVKGMVTLFVTLTYSNKYIPYIRKSDLELYNGEVFPIYRDFNVRRVRCVPLRPHKRSKGKFVRDLDNVFYDFKDYHFGCLDYLVTPYSDIVPLMPALRGQRKDKSFFVYPDKVGVIYYKDLQDFFKRLSINYKRLYHENSSYSFFACAEYGPQTKRPHFHLSLHIPADKVDNYVEAIIKSWQFSSSYRLRKGIEIAKDVSSYLSSYVNTFTSLSPIYREKTIAPKCTHSKHYGFNRIAFSLAEIEKKINSRDFTFTYNVVTKTFSHLVSRLLPSYVISYWFPKIQGFTKLSTAELIEIYTNPLRLNKYKHLLNYNNDEIVDVLDEYNDHKVGCVHKSFYQRISEYVDNFMNDDNFYNHEEKIYKRSTLHRNISIIRAAQLRFLAEHTVYPEQLDYSDFQLHQLYRYVRILSMKDSSNIRYMRMLSSWINEREVIYQLFANYCVTAWSVYSCQSIKEMYNIDIKSRYENIYEFFEPRPSVGRLGRIANVSGVHRFPSLDDNVQYELDVNDNTYNNSINLRLVDKFYKYDKAKKVNNTIYSQNYFDF